MSRKKICFLSILFFNIKERGHRKGDGDDACKRATTNGCRGKDISCPHVWSARMELELTSRSSFSFSLRVCGCACVEPNGISLSSFRPFVALTCVCVGEGVYQAVIQSEMKDVKEIITGTRVCLASHSSCQEHSAL